MDDKQENKIMSTAVSSEEIEINIEVFVDQDENTVYVKFENFEELEDAEDYAEYLVENLPLLLFQSKSIH
jgi:hypothetical protein